MAYALISLKLQGPRGLNEAGTRSVAVERTSIDDWIDDEDVEFENGNEIQRTPERGDGDYEPTTPRGSDSEVEMDTA